MFLDWNKLKYRKHPSNFKFKNYKKILGALENVGSKFHISNSKVKTVLAAFSIHILQVFEF